MRLNHSIYEPQKQINLKEKCKYCGKSLEEILLESKAYGYTYKDAMDKVPCLTEDEYIIKSIIE